MVTIAWLICGLIAVQHVFVLWNLSGLLEPERLSLRRRKRMELHSPEQVAGQPKVSVLIPARNEELNIADCLASVLAQRVTGDLEVIVLDDGSTDRTADIVREFASRDIRVKLLHGSGLPAGWTGKSYACHQLSEQATGSQWLFLDADARLLAGGLPKLLSALDAAGGGLVTGFPHQQTVTWLERLIVPLMAFTVSCHLPIRMSMRSSDPKLTAAHGACLLLDAQTYRMIGGHAAFGGHLVDDMQLAMAVKRAGRPYQLADVSGCVTMRMYRDAGEVWRGYKKNVFAGVGRHTSILATVLVMYLVMFVVPMLGLVASIWHQPLFVPSIVGYALGVCMKTAIDIKWRLQTWIAWAMPASIILLTLIAFDSWRTSKFGKRYEWKGRLYE